MTNLEKLQSFFEAENLRNWTTYESFMHDKIRWELHGQQIEVIQGKNHYLSRIKAAYAQSNQQFSCLHYECTVEQERIVTLLKNDAGQLSCDIFEFENGLIIREWEFLL